MHQYGKELGGNRCNTSDSVEDTMSFKGLTHK